MTNRQPDNQPVEGIVHPEHLLFDLASQVESLFASGVENATERVLNSHREVIPNEEMIMSLLYAEVVAADQICKPLTEKDLIARFPSLRDRISRLMAFHESLKIAPDSDPWDSSTFSAPANDTVTPNASLETTREQVDPTANRIPQREQFEIDQFEILEKIGQGGMGVVYRARQKGLDRIVALKVLRNQLNDSEDRPRLMNEALAVARLRHPGIVQIHHVGETSGQPYLCFEYIDGCHLGDRLASATMLPRDACVLLKKIASAISSAHQHGIIHRDLKPANILIDASGEPKVADFGLAKFLDSNADPQNRMRLTQTGVLVGTICYMAPEQLTGNSDDVDCRADIYGLGAILYEMLGGRPPLLGDSPNETMSLVQTAEPAALRKLNPKVPRDIETICSKCLEKSPDQRFQSVQALEQELQRFLDGVPLKIRPVSPWTRAGRWCRRRPTIAAMSAVMSVLLLALAAGGYWMAWNQRNQAVLLQAQRDLAQTAERVASEKAQEAAEVTQFMINTLRSAHPSRDGRNVTVAERLSDGLRELEQTYPGSSTGKAALLKTIGSTYEGLGLYQESLSPLRSAWQLNVQQAGPEARESLVTESMFGDVLTKLGRYQEARSHLQHARDGLVGLLGPDSEAAIAAEDRLAQNIYELGDRSQALQLYQANYQRAKNSLAPGHPTIIVTLLAYANALKMAGHFTEASELINPMMPVAEQHLGKGHLLVTNLKSASAAIDRANGNYVLALNKFREIHELLGEKLGESHPRTIKSLSDFAVVHTDMGHYEKTREIAELIRTRLARALGENHPQSFRAVLNVARSLEIHDRRNEARALLGETYKRASTELGPRHLETMILATHYGRCLAEDNQLTEAETLLTMAMQSFRDAKMVDPILRIEPLYYLGSLYRRTERPEQAVKMFKAARDIASAAFGESNPKTLTAKNNLANAYHALDRADQAIPLHLEVLDGLNRVLGEEHPDTLVTALNLAIIYRDESRSEEAVEILTKVVPVINRIFKNSWLVHTAQFQLGRSYLDIESIKQARQHLEVAFAGFERLMDQQPASETIGIANQMRRIIEQFESSGQTSDAQIWRKRRAMILESHGLPTEDEATEDDR